MSTEKKRDRYVSYSQYSTFSGCQQKFKLERIDKIGEYASNIHFIFGTAMHETIQDFLEIYYGETKKMAMSIDLHEQLLANLKKQFVIEEEKMGGKLPCTQVELGEFYQDGCNILTTLKNKVNKFYPKSGYELIGNEVKLFVDIKDGIKFIGYIDIALKDLISGKVIIIDLKTSTKGWSKYQKMDKVKTSQMLLYKKYYSDLYDVPMDKITVEYHILKRKVGEYNGFPLPRISKFVPANGKPSTNKAYDSFMQFVNYVFNDDGTFKENPYPPNVTRLCDWCDYKTSGDCSAFSFNKKT